MNNDSIFIKYLGPAVAIGLLPDTSKYYPVVYCTAAACYLPTLAVFSKNGFLISEAQISNGCGSDCGYNCSDSLFINSISDIKLKLSQEFYSCDSIAREIERKEVLSS